MIKHFINQIICKCKGHDWEGYTIYNDFNDNYFEPQGYCKRCGYDTKGQYR